MYWKMHNNNHTAIKRISIIFLMLLFLATSALADDTFTYRKGVPVDLKFPCLNNENYCSNAAICTLSVINPDSKMVIDNRTMTVSNGFSNYSIPPTNVSSIGIYKGSVVCNDNGEYGNSQFSLLITDENTTYNNTLVIVIGLGIVIFLLLYMAFNLEIAEHPVLRAFFMVMAVSMLVLIPKSIIWGQNTLTTFVRATQFIFTAFWVYVFIYIIYIIFTVYVNPAKIAKKPKKQQR